VREAEKETLLKEAKAELELELAANHTSLQALFAGQREAQAASLQQQRDTAQSAVTAQLDEAFAAGKAALAKVFVWFFFHLFFLHSVVTVDWLDRPHRSTPRRWQRHVSRPRRRRSANIRSPWGRRRRRASVT
jgi:hypothetical protein